MLKKVGAVFLFALFAGCLVTAAVAGTRASSPKRSSEDSVQSKHGENEQISAKQPLAVLPSAIYRFDPVVEGQEVAHVFIVQNKGSAPLKIERVKTD